MQRPTYPVALRVITQDGASVEGALLRLNAQEYTTSANGRVNLNLPSGLYPCTVIVEGEELVTQQLVVASEPLETIIIIGDFVPVSISTRGQGSLEVRTAARVLANGDTAPQGVTLTVQAKPQAGYGLATLSVNGEDVTKRAAGGVYTFKLRGSAAIVASFKQSATPIAELLGEVLVRPNPFTDRLVLEGLGHAERLTLLNALGQPVYRKQLTGEENLELNLAHLPAGTYWLRVEGAGKGRTLKW
jgi:putative immunoreactive 47 kDa antigen PG97